MLFRLSEIVLMHYSAKGLVPISPLTPPTFSH
ncbi:hypothetical protein T05_14289 [Trichinella murrelli]|uniref:Uncharacterized protein n=1 Tax=Trichinella murrelli TaxID=144512 RepID=A0A0V0T266_9BILA|nr:hypothetical protein T05_14289 [Trichinella murrelli]